MWWAQRQAPGLAQWVSMTQADLAPTQHLGQEQNLHVEVSLHWAIWSHPGVRFQSHFSLQALLASGCHLPRKLELGRIFHCVRARTFSGGGASPLGLGLCCYWGSEQKGLCQWCQLTEVRAVRNWWTLLIPLFHVRILEPRQLDGPWKTQMQKNILFLN